MTDFEKQIEDIRQRAIEANRKIGADGVLGIHAKLKGITISPLAAQRVSKPELTKDWLIAQIPDLLDLALWVHYEFQRQATEKRTTTTSH